MVKQLTLSVIAYFVISMVLAVLWHLVLFDAQYQAMGVFTRGKPIMLFGMIAIVLQGLVFGYFYPFYIGHGGYSTLKKSLQYSIFMGVNVWTVMVFATAAKFDIEPVWEFVAFGTAFQLLQFLSVGCGLHLVHRISTR